MDEKIGGRGPSTLSRIVNENKWAFLSALAFGLAAHMFAFTNKLMNADEVESLFGKGATVTSGRWGLEWVKLIFPDFSMPWLYGIISLILLALSACLIINLFEIKGRLMQVLLSGMLTAFPAQTGVFCFMFTSSAYALAFIMSVLAVYLPLRQGWKGLAAGFVLLTLSLSIYQAYIAVTASLFVLWLVKGCLDGRGIKELVICAVKCLAMMLAAMVFYYGISLLVLRLAGESFNTYVTGNVNAISFPRKVRMAYDFFYYTFSYREFAYLSGPFSRLLHLVCMALCAIALLWESVRMIRTRRAAAAAMMLVLCALLPLAINCMFLVMAKESIHSLVLYSFVAVYVLAALLCERVLGAAAFPAKLGRDIVYFALASVLVSNVFFANQCYLKMHLQYENAYSFYSILLGRVQKLPGYNEDTEIAIIGHQDNKLYTFPQFDLGYLKGPGQDLVNIYSRENFLRRYMGVNVALADAAEVESISQTEEFAQMAEYPYYGSLAMIDGVAVVKLG